jgi:hypothetical protein
MNENDPQQASRACPDLIHSIDRLLRIHIKVRRLAYGIDDYAFVAIFFGSALCAALIWAGIRFIP